MDGHTKMIIDMVWDKDQTFLYTASSDTTARCWMPEIGEEIRGAICQIDK
jgi:WD40 repeat protein